MAFECGGGALCGEILDALTGKIVLGFPSAYMTQVESDNDNFDFNTKVDSSLLMISGIGEGIETDENGREVPRGAYLRYYNFDGRHLKLVSLERNE